MRRLIRFTLVHARATVAAFGLLSAAWVPLLFTLRLETDGRDLFPPRHPAVVYQEQVDAAFAGSDFLIAGVEADPGYDIFAPAPLNAVLRLTREAAALPGVEAQEVRSLATEPAPEWIDDALHLRPPLRATVHDAAEAEEVRRAALREDSFRGVLLSADGRGTALYVPLRKDADRPALQRALKARLDDQPRIDPRLASGYRFHLLGSAAAESLLGEHVLGDLARLLPLALLVVAGTLWCWFRQVSIVLAGLGEGSSVVLWTLGAMAALGQPISLVTVVMPVILVTYCVADTIHLAQHFRAHCPGDATAAERVAAMDRTLDEVLKPVTFTALATAAGFVAFAVSPIPPVRDFGLFTAAGVLFALVVSVLVVPASVLAFGFGRRPAARRPAVLPFARPLADLNEAAARAPWVVVAGTLGLTALATLGARRLEVRDSWIRNFDGHSAIVQADAWFNRGFHGSNVLNVVATPAGGTVHDPVFLADLRRLQDTLDRMDEVGGTRSLVEPLEVVAKSLEGARRLPRDRRESEGLALLYRMAGGQRALDAYVDAAGASANVWVFLNRADDRRTDAVMRQVARFRWEGPPPAIHLAGDAYLGHQLVEAIARSQAGSALAAVALTFLVVWAMLRSKATALLVMLPVALSVAWNYGIMGWIGLPLGVATSMFCAIAFGVGVDFALHWISRLELGLRRGLGWEEAIRFTGASTGGAILLEGVVLVLGFGVLLFSAAPPNRHLAVVLGINLGVCLAASLLLLPATAALVLRRRRRVEAPRPLEITA